MYLWCYRTGVMVSQRSPGPRSSKKLWYGNYYFFFIFFVYRIVKVNGKFVKLCNPIVWNYLLSISARKNSRCFSTHMFIWKQTVRNRKYIMRVWRVIIRFFFIEFIGNFDPFPADFFSKSRAKAGRFDPAQAVWKRIPIHW